MTVAALVLLLLELLGGALVLRALGRLPRLTPRPGAGHPLVAVVVAARDEESTLEPALVTLLAEAGPGVRIVVVDDRSTDGTGAIAQRLAEGSPWVTATRVEALPPGWLGKNHALHAGAAAAPDAELLLFTDADVHFAPGAIAAAAALADELDLDHLTGAPRVVARGPVLGAMVATFAVLFALFTRPWRVADARSSAAVGIGALNLVRRGAYDRIGGHRAVALRVDDDLALGSALKAAGARSAFCYATDAAAVEWYPSPAAMVRGLEKNAFAGVGFRTSAVLAATAVLLAVCFGPWLLAALPSTPAPARWLALGAGALQLLGASLAARDAGLPRAVGLLFPVGVALFLFTLWRSMLLTLARGRVTWRGTSYPLAELRRFARRG